MIYTFTAFAILVALSTIAQAKGGGNYVGGCPQGTYFDSMTLRCELTPGAKLADWASRHAHLPSISLRIPHFNFNLGF